MTRRGLWTALGVGIVFVAIMGAPHVMPDKGLLLGHFEIPDMQYYLEHGVLPYECDAFVYGHYGREEEAAVTALKEEGYGVFRYANVLTYPIEEWVDQGDPWNDFMWHTMLEEWGATIESNGKLAIFPWFYEPYLIGWHKLSESQIQVVVDTLYTITNGEECGLFLDQSWQTLSAWMFSTKGCAISEISMLHQAVWAKNFRIFLNKCDEKWGRARVIVNGDDLLRPPNYLENSHWAWEASLAIWRADKLNILSVNADYTSYVVAAVGQWAKEGGWLAFTGEPEKVKAAYNLANEER